jgi:hypothetical protein
MLRETVLFVLLAALYLPPPSAAQSAAPSWYFDRTAEYPGQLYISAVGEGKTRAEAEAVAVAGVSLFFNLLGFNSPPLGAVTAGGAGDLFPRIRKYF